MATNRSTWNRGKGYAEDSKFETELRQGVLKDLEYHPNKIKYTVSHTYEPDWETYIEFIDEDGFTRTKLVLIEAKGMFRESSELQKYVAIKKSLETKVGYSELVFLFQKPHAPIYFKPKRKDGSKMTHAEWATKHNFRYFTESTIKEIL